MLDKLFLQVFDMSLTAGWVILFVLSARLFLKKAPKGFSYLLWSVVLFRLICPVSFESIFSVFGIAFRGVNNVSPMGGEISSVILPAAVVSPQSGAVAVMPLNSISFTGIFSAVWLLGMAIMLALGIASLLRLKIRLKNAVKLKDNIYLSDEIPTAFVLGLLRPKIYLPISLSDREREYILLHEQTHIKRLDHGTKVLGFLALCIHWFNPLVWVAFFAFSKDMELSCDEAVIRNMGNDIKRDYSASLLSLSAGKTRARCIPLAFSENDTKSRVKNVLKYKRPAFFVTLTAAAVCGVSVFCLVSNPKSVSPPALYAYWENGVIPMSLGSYSWGKDKADAVPYTEMEYKDAISYDDNKGHKNANIFFSTSNTPSDFNTDNAKGTKDFKIVEMRRYSEGKEEILKDFSDNLIEVSLEKNISYIYEFKVQFGENYGYYSIKINNNTGALKPDTTSQPKPDTSKRDLLSYDEMVKAALMHKKDSYLQGECFGEGHIILGTEEKGEEVKIYTLTMVGQYGFVNNNFEKISGSGIIPAVITTKNNSVEIQYPEDGSGYAPSIKELFPLKYHSRIFNQTESDKKSMSEQERAYAEKYLTEIGRKAKIGDYRDFEHLLLTDLGVLASVSNKLEDFYKDNYMYPYFVGTRECVEDGVRMVYEMSYDKAKEEIVFKKYPYDTKKPSEQFKFNAKTGESIEKAQ